MSLTPEQILGHGGHPVGLNVLNQQDHSIHWKQCLTCRSVLPFSAFRRDSSYREGVRDQCAECEHSPRLSTSEHVTRLRELNYYSQAVKRQRWTNQEDYENEAARLSAKWMHRNEFIWHIKKLIPHIFVIDGKIVGDVGVYRTFDHVQPNGLDYQYLWFLPSGMMPEWSVYEFNDRDIPVRERVRGWRTPLQRLIQQGLVTEEAARKEFGEARGAASIPWRRDLYDWRNRHKA